MIVLFFLSVFLFSLAFWRHRSPLFLFRSIGLTLSILIILTLNLNWIFKAPINLGLATTVFLALFLFFLFYQKRYRENVFNFREFFSRQWILLIFLFLISFLFTFQYFEGKLNEPRYLTPDSAGHYLYMAPTAQSGIMPIFAPNRIYPASNFNEIYVHHHDGYFPGASVAFYLISKLKSAVTPALIQVFNVIFYILTASYLAIIVLRKKIIKSWWIIAIFLIVLFLGTFFDLLTTSYSNQLFGLFLLVFFVDVFSEFYEGRIGMFSPAAALSGLIISYFFWLPVAILFVIFTALPGFILLIKNKLSAANPENKKAWKVILLMIFSFAISIGYILVTIRAGTLGLADEGTATFRNYFYPNVIFILPFFIFNIYFLFKKRKENNFLLAFSLSALLYSFLIFLGNYFGEISGYALIKSYFLTISLIWIVGLNFIDEYAGHLKIIFSKLKIKFIEKGNYFEQGVKFICLGLFLFSVLSNVNLKKFEPSKREGAASFISKNISLMVIRDKYRNITQDQLNFIDKLKTDYRWSLQDNRILINAPADSALWVFAYAGIWPRTLSLIPEGSRNFGSFSSMNVYSRDIFDYGQWLQNDKSHILAYFDNPASHDWAQDNNFDINSYNKIFASGNNYLLSLKDGMPVRYIHQMSDNEDFTLDSPIKGKKEAVKTPYVGNFRPSDKKLEGISFLVSVRNKQLKGNYILEIDENSCSDKGETLLKKIVNQEEISRTEDNKYLEVLFDSALNLAKNEEYCLKFYPENDDSQGAVQLKKDSLNQEIIRKEYYIYDAS